MAARERHSNGFPRAKDRLCCYLLAHIELNIISLIIVRGHIQYIKFTAGYYHLVLTPRRKNRLHLDMTDILPESIRQGAIFPIMGLLLCWLLISAFQK